MNPVDIDLLLTICASLIVMACGAGAILVLPWGELPDPKAATPDTDPVGDTLLDNTAIGVTIG